MTERQKQAARLRITNLCPNCGGTGRSIKPSALDQLRKAGNASYLKSLEPGQLSYAERGRRGGRPPALTLEDLGLTLDNL